MADSDTIAVVSSVPIFMILIAIREGWARPFHRRLTGLISGLRFGRPGGRAAMVLWRGSRGCTQEMKFARCAVATRDTPRSNYVVLRAFRKPLGSAIGSRAAGTGDRGKTRTFRAVSNRSAGVCLDYASLFALIYGLWAESYRGVGARRAGTGDLATEWLPTHELRRCWHVAASSEAKRLRSALPALLWRWARPPGSPMGKARWRLRRFRETRR